MNVGSGISAEDSISVGSDMNWKAKSKACSRKQIHTRYNTGAL